MNRLDIPPLEGEIVERKGLRVKDLIAKLQELDPEMPVLTQDCCHGIEHDVDISEYKLDTYDKWEAERMHVEVGTVCVMID